MSANRHNAFLQDHHAITCTEVQHSLRATELTDVELKTLLAEAARIWPGAWKARIVARIPARDFIGTPIAEYKPEALAHGRVALIATPPTSPPPSVAWASTRPSLISAP
ncbi:hypothetical protein [Microbacterium sp. K24]|uniref:hypothetical protein n=1 Tax=Microbacterium sp. K24 TaxID=2305446 RepID=UPI00109C76D6|nr:hypothetical protein [Microbacterium sp. K24]